MRQILLIVFLSLFVVAVSQLLGMTSAKADLALPAASVKADQTETPLMKAVAQEDISAVKKNLKEKGDINSKDKAGNTALLYAVSTGSVEIVKLILQKKPDLKIAYGENQENVLFEAVRVNNVEIARLLVKADKEILSQLNLQGENPLFLAAREGAAETATFLIAQGMSAKMKNKKGQTAIEIATENNLDATVKVLKASK